MYFFLKKNIVVILSANNGKALSYVKSINNKKKFDNNKIEILVLFIK